MFSLSTFLNLSFACQLPFHALLIALFCWTFSVLCSKNFLILVSQDWEQNSTPIVAKGKEPKFIKPSDKFSSTEGENVFCFLEVQGDPIPTVTWFKVFWNFYVFLVILPFLSRCPKTSKQSRGVKCGQVGPAQLFLDFKRLSKMMKVWAQIFDQLMVTFDNQLQEPIDARSRTNMGWWSTNSVYMSQVGCFLV